MGAEADDRVRGALLAGLGLAAFVVGAWWWRDAAPATGPIEATVTPAPLDPTAGRRLAIDPVDGQIIEGAGSEETVVIHQESGAPAATLISHTVWEDRSHLDQTDPPLVRQTTPSMGERYLLVASCTGPGKLTVSFSGSEDDGPGQPVTCEEQPVTIVLTSSGGPLEVRFAVSDGELDLDARFSALF